MQTFILLIYLPFSGSKKIVLHGGTHAREWISPITMINFAKQLVDEYRAGSDAAKYLDDITWYIHINMNPGTALIMLYLVYGPFSLWAHN